MTRKSNDCPEGQHGPVYNVTGQRLAGYRKTAKDGLAVMSAGERHAYGATVEAAVLEMQRRQFIREACEADQRPNCASGSWANSPGAVGDAVRRQQQAALLSCPARVRAARTAQEWESLYVEAMPKGFIPSWERPTEQEEIAA